MLNMPTLRFAPSTLCLAILFAASSAFLPAGPADAQYTHRLTRVLYDFDNNTIPDAERTFVYNAAGEVTSTSYTYTSDGTPDLLNTEDDDTTQEDTTFGYDATGRVDDVDLVRNTGSQDVDAFFVGDEYDRIDVIERDAMGTVVADSFIDFSYAGGDMTSAAVRITATGATVNTLLIGYGSNDLPSDYDSIGGISIFNTLSWNAKGDITFIDSVASAGFGSGTGTFTYQTTGTNQLASEVWTQTGAVGSLYSEYPGRNYQKTYTYDANELRTTESVDRDSDGSVEAVLTFEWEAGVCNPSFNWAPNGRPNFSTTQDDPSLVPATFVPGTGTFYLENCGPFPVPEPSFAGITLAGVALLGAAGQGRRRRLTARR